MRHIVEDMEKSDNEAGDTLGAGDFFKALALAIPISGCMWLALILFFSLERL